MMIPCPVSPYVPELMPMRSDRRAPSARVLATLVCLGLSACGGTLAQRVDTAMSGCISLRNPDFVSGRGAAALDRALPASLAKAMDRIAYMRTFKLMEAIASSAADQVTLVCALEIASRLRHQEVALLLTQYSAHPDEAVAASAKRLLKGQDPLPGSVREPLPMPAQ